MINTLLKLGFPFILAASGAPTTEALSTLIDKVDNSDKGLICRSWVEQNAILQHENLGWFLTHGGWNSISESLSQGVPMIIWPMAMSDQPMNAARLSTGEKPVAFELMQVSTIPICLTSIFYFFDCHHCILRTPIKIRQGHARAPALRGGAPIIGDDANVEQEFEDIFTKARGPEGENLRANAIEMAAQLLVERNGPAKKVIAGLASGIGY